MKRGRPKQTKKKKLQSYSNLYLKKGNTGSGENTGRETAASFQVTTPGGQPSAEERGPQSNTITHINFDFATRCLSTRNLDHVKTHKK